jgi:hypothetical protein
MADVLTFGESVVTVGEATQRGTFAACRPPALPAAFGSGPASPGGVRPRCDPGAIARRLGVGVAVLETYMHANGGVPNGTAVHEPERAPASGSSSLGEGRASAARDRPPWVKRDRPPWVKRDRPRYFIPG